MIDSGLTRKARLLYRDLGWALVMSREGVLSRATFERLHERFREASAVLSSRHPTPAKPAGEAKDLSESIAQWLGYLELFVASNVKAAVGGPTHSSRAGS